MSIAVPFSVVLSQHNAHSAGIFVVAIKLSGLTLLWHPVQLDIALSVSVSLICCLCISRACLYAGKGGGDQHYGSWYTGLAIKPFGQTWPLCFTVNWDNYGSRKPINPLIRDAEACDKLYTETLRLINDNATKKIEPLGRSPAFATS